MDSVTAFFSHFIQPDPQTAAFIILNLILIESLLSVDNAAVLATLVMDLPEADRKRALRIGIVLAYIFRGLALVFASFLVKIAWLKLAGGAYLLFLSAEFFYKLITQHKHVREIEEDKMPEAAKHPRKLPFLNVFWSTVVMVELMDMTFSIDNVFAAVAFTENIYLVCTGVFIGIITMRIVAGYFVKLMEKFPFLDTMAFLVIGILGFRLSVDFFCHYFPENPLCVAMEGEHADLYFSISTVGIFLLPIITSLLFNFPRRNK